MLTAEQVNQVLAMTYWTDNLPPPDPVELLAMDLSYSDTLAARITIATLRRENKRLRRVIVVLCLLGLGLIAYGFLHNAFLSAATAMAVGSSWGDFIA